MEPMPTRHPLFDPASQYSQARAGFAPEDKLRGYFRWLARCLRAETVQTLRLAAESGPRPALVLLAGTPETVVPAQVEVQWTPRKNAPGALRVRLRLINPSALSGRLTLPAPFRAFLLEPEVVERLSQAIEAPGQAGESVLPRVFSAEVVAGNLEVARVLSAVPELEGIVNADGSGTTSLAAIPPTSPPVEVVPPAVTIVVVIDNPTEPAP
jgi:hypothetical protein